MEDKNLWYTQLVKFLSDEILPINLRKSTMKAFKLKASHFCVLGYVLYCRGFDGILLICLKWVDSQIVISCTHDRICGAHFSGPTIMKLLMHMGYYCPTREHDCIKYIKKMC